jgi:hypothetical protein
LTFLLLSCSLGLLTASEVATDGDTDAGDADDVTVGDEDDEDDVAAEGDEEAKFGEL